jgi:hypothetical protein
MIFVVTIQDPCPTLELEQEAQTAQHPIHRVLVQIH